MAELAAERRSEEDIDALHAMIQEIEAIANDPDRYVDTGTTFHLRFAEADSNYVFKNQLSSIRELLRVWVRSVLEAAGETESSLAMPRQSRDTTGAWRMMAAHLERAGRRLREALDDHPKKTSLS